MRSSHLTVRTLCVLPLFKSPNLQTRGVSSTLAHRAPGRRPTAGAPAREDGAVRTGRARPHQSSGSRIDGIDQGLRRRNQGVGLLVGQLGSTQPFHLSDICLKLPDGCGTIVGQTCLSGTQRSAQGLVNAHPQLEGGDLIDDSL